jgi:uncharacterized protein
MIWLIFGFFMLISWLISNTLESKFRKYALLPVNDGLTGKSVAERMLHSNGIYDVKVISVDGQLTDHYNPQDKTVNLSADVYNMSNVAAAAVAAHECGHAVQHAQVFAPLRLRSSLVPIVSFASKWIPWILLSGILLLNVAPGLLLAGIILFAMTTLFSFITLPVEIDASRRALLWLNSSGITTAETQPKAKDALNWAAYTYVIAALSSLATLLYYISLYSGRRN